MNISRRTLALLLCLCLLAALLAGCGKQSQQTESAPTPSPVPTPEPTPEPPDPAKLYAEASGRLAAASLLCADYSISREITLPDYASEKPGAAMFITEDCTRSAQYQGLGTGSLLAVVDDALDFGKNNRATQRLVYADGIEYVTVNTAQYYTAVKEEDFLAGQLPLLLLDTALYGHREAQETEGGWTLLFTEASAAESWAMPEEAELLEASGSAVLSAAGELSSAAYTLRYAFGGLVVSNRWEVRYQIPETLDLSASVPENTKHYESLDDPGAPLAVLRARTLLRQANAVSAAYNIQYFTEAGGYSFRYYETMSLLDRVTKVLLHGESSISAVDYNSRRTISYGYTTDYAQGKMTTTFHDGETQETSLTLLDVRQNSADYLCRYFPSYDSLKDAESKDVGAYRLISFAGAEGYGTAIKDQIGKELFSSEPDILDTHAESYLTKSLTGFLAIERVSGIPTALNLSFTGIHTIEGMPFELDMELNLGLSLYTENAAGDILEEPPAGPEPEQKPTPVFYEVSDEEGNTLYLLGTIHIGDDRTAWLPQVIYDALEASDALAVEFDVESFEENLDQDEDLQAELLQSYYYTDGTGIQNHLDSELYKEALDLIKIAGNYTDTAENMKPYLWGNAIELFYLSQGRKLSSDKGVDNRLMRLARAAEKEILDVESGAFQVSLMGGYTDQVQQMLLTETTATSRKDYLESCYRLYEAWCGGDEETLKQRLSAMSEEDRAALDEDELAVYDEYNQKMVVERNANMVEKAREYLQSGKTVFCAVGLAHLLGEGGMVDALRAAGYTVTLIDTH